MLSQGSGLCVWCLSSANWGPWLAWPSPSTQSQAARRAEPLPQGLGIGLCGLTDGSADSCSALVSVLQAAEETDNCSLPSTLLSLSHS